MKNLNINNSNLFRNFALVCSFLLVSFNLSAQYAPLATATSFASNSQTNPGTGLDLRYDFGWERSNDVSFNNTSKSIVFPKDGTHTVKTIDFKLTTSNSLSITFQPENNGRNSRTLTIEIFDLTNTNVAVSTTTLTQSSTPDLRSGQQSYSIPKNNLTIGNDYFLVFTFSSTNTNLTLSNFSTDATPSILPVTYSSLSAKQVLGSVQVNWVTSMEENSSHFEIERSVNGSNWEMIGSENAVGFSTEEVSYSFTDYSPASGTNIYRLKQVDFDGQYAYSNVMVVLLSNTIAEETIQLFPNPSKGIVNIKGVDSPKVTVYNTAGTALYVTQNQTSLNLDFLQLGVYFLQIESQDGTVTKHRFLKD